MADRRAEAKAESRRQKRLSAFDFSDSIFP